MITLHHSNRTQEARLGGLLKNEESKTKKPHSASERAKLSPVPSHLRALRRHWALVGRAATWAAQVPLVMNMLLCCFSQSLLSRQLSSVRSGMWPRSHLDLHLLPVVYGVEWCRRDAASTPHTVVAPAFGSSLPMIGYERLGFIWRQRGSPVTARAAWYTLSLLSTWRWW